MDYSVLSWGLFCHRERIDPSATHYVVTERLTFLGVCEPNEAGSGLGLGELRGNKCWR